MRRRNGPLQTMSDSQVLTLAARHFARRAQELRDLCSRGGTPLSEQPLFATEYEVLGDTARRLRELARRVPLWTDRAR